MMIRLAGRRVAETIPLLFLLSLLIFALFKQIPGDYLSAMEINPSISSETVSRLRHSYGLDQPFHVQYFSWIKQILTGNLGYSFAQHRPAASLVVERFANTLILGAAALLTTLLISVPLGAGAALNLHRWPDRMALFLSLVGLSVPSIVGALLFLYFAFRTGWFPLGGTGGFLHLVLPSLTLALPSMAFFVRNLRLELVDVFQQPFMLAAVARGLPPHRVLMHALRHALNPTISMAGIMLSGLLSGAVVVEKIFDWPGLGALVVDSILARDLFVVVDCVLFSALLVIGVNLAADLLLAWNDPRIRDS